MEFEPFSSASPKLPTISHQRTEDHAYKTLREMGNPSILQQIIDEVFYVYGYVQQTENHLRRKAVLGEGRGGGGAYLNMKMPTRTPKLSQTSPDVVERLPNTKD